MSDKILEIKNLNAGYETYRGVSHVLKNFNLEVEKGEKIGVIGESGCGKTTTMQSVNQILPSNAVIKGGEINFKGENVLKMKEKELMKLRKKGVNMIPQDPSASLNPLYKVETQLRDVLEISTEDGTSYYNPFMNLFKSKFKNLKNDGRKDKDYYREKSLKLLEDVKLSDPERVLDSYPFQLSGGMKQRVCIAMSLASLKDLLIADEPTTNLDVTIQHQVLNLIKNLLDKENLSAILVSQALGAVKKFVDKIYVVYGGSVVEVGTTETIFNDAFHPYTQGLIECMPKLTGGGFSEGIAGQTPEYVNPPTGCRFSPRCPNSSNECKNNTPSLIEVEKNHFVACEGA